MGILDRLNSLADKLHIGSDQYYAPTQRRAEDYPPPYDTHQQDYGQQSYEDQGYDEYYEDNGNNYQQGREDPQGYDYETGFGSGDGYSRAGARIVRSPSPRGQSKGLFEGLFDRFRRPEPEPVRRAPDNVVSLHRAGGEVDNPVRRDTRPVYGEERVEPHEETTAYFDEPAPLPASRQTLIHLVRRLDDAEQIIDHMLSGGNVIVNMEEIDDTLKRRVLDVVSGAAYALEATVQRISYGTYYVAPSGQEILTNASVRDRDRDSLEEGGYRTSRRY